MGLSFTPTGRALLALAVAACACGWLLGYEAGLVLGAACLAAVVLGLAWVLPGRAWRLDQVLEPAAVTAGDPARVHLAVHRGPHRRVLPLTVELPVGSGTERAVVGRLDREVAHDIATDRRGVFAIGPARISRADPLGLWRRTREVGPAQDLWVYPRVELVDMATAGRREDVDGVNAAFATQGGIAFHSLREYQHGDDLRAVHWKSSARTGTLMVRQQAEASRPLTTVVLDTRTAAHDDDSFDAAVEIAASLVVSNAVLVRPVELRTTDGREVGTLGAAAPAEVFLKALAEVSAVDTGSFALVEEDLLTSAADTLFFVTTGAMAAEDAPALAKLAGRFDTVTVIDVRPGQRPGPDGDTTAARLATPSAPVPVVAAASARELARAWGASRP